MAAVLLAGSTVTHQYKQWQKRQQKKYVILTPAIINDIHTLLHYLGTASAWRPVDNFSEAPWPFVWHVECHDMTSDASGTWGLGAAWNQHVIQRAWLPHKQPLPIYIKEMVAVVEALETWGAEVERQNILFWVDN
jgi:hypothetical protein